MTQKYSRRIIHCLFPVHIFLPRHGTLLWHSTERLRKDQPVTPCPAMVQSEEKKRCPSNSFGKKKDKNEAAVRPAVVVNGSYAAQTTPAHDSAYASSDSSASLASCTNTRNHGGSSAKVRSLNVSRYGNVASVQGRI